MGPPHAATETTLAKSLLYAALEMMQREMEMDKLINQAAELFAEEFFESYTEYPDHADENTVEAQWHERKYRQLPDDILTYVIAEGKKRNEQWKRAAARQEQAEIYKVTDEALRNHLNEKGISTAVSPPPLNSEF